MAFSGSNFAPLFPTLSKENSLINSSIVKSSLELPGFHPKKANIFTNDSEKYPFSLYPDEISLDFGSVHSNGKTGNPSLSPSLLLNFPLPSGFNISEVPIKIIKIDKKIEFSDEERVISISPSKLSLNIDFALKFKNKIIGNQRNKFKIYEDDLTDVYNSRTFCLFEDIECIKKKGLAKGGSLDNAIVVKDKEILNKEGLRNDKEFVNHKILDCIGDLYTSGFRIIGDVTCSQGGHYLTNQLLRKVFDDKNNFSLIEIREKNLPHTLINRSLLRSIA